MVLPGDEPQQTLRARHHPRVGRTPTVRPVLAYRHLHQRGLPQPAQGPAAPA